MKTQHPFPQAGAAWEGKNRQTEKEERRSRIKTVVEAGINTNMDSFQRASSRWLCVCVGWGLW